MKTLSIAEFVGKLKTAGSRMEMTGQAALKKAAELIEAEAKLECDDHHDGLKPTDGSKPELRDSISHEVVGLSVCIGSDSGVLLQQELGTESGPPRPVFGPALLHEEQHVLKVIGNAAASLLANDANTAWARLE